MVIYTIGFTKKSAETFFSLIKNNNIAALVDIRLNNVSQLAGFTKGQDLKFFLSELCKCKYEHEEQAAPTKEILDGYKKGDITWEEYESRYKELIRSRDVLENFLNKHENDENVCLLCSEPTPEHCHRRLFAELLKGDQSNISICHL